MSGREIQCPLYAQYLTLNSFIVDNRETKKSVTVINGSAPQPDAEMKEAVLHRMNYRKILAKWTDLPWWKKFSQRSPNCIFDI